jgi:hypothetical protein
MTWPRRAWAWVLAAAMMCTSGVGYMDATNVLRPCASSCLSGRAAQAPVADATASRPFVRIHAGTQSRVPGVHLAILPSAASVGTNGISSIPTDLLALSLPSSPAESVSGRGPPLFDLATAV